MKLRKLLRGGGGRIIGARELKDIQRTEPTESTKQGSLGAHRDWSSNHRASISLYKVFWIHAMVLSSGCLWDSYQWTWECLTLLPALGSLFIFLGCLIQPWYEGWCLVLLHFVKLSSADSIGRPGLFWRETEERWIQGKWRGQTGRSEGRGGWGHGVCYGRSIKKFNWAKPEKKFCKF